MNDAAPDDLARAAYEALPEPIKMLYSYEQYLWLDDAGRGRLVERECEPEQYVD